MEENGQKKTMELKIIVDLETQTAKMEFDPKDFKTFDMVLFALETVKRETEFRIHVGRLAFLQHQQNEQAKSQAIERSIFGR